MVPRTVQLVGRTGLASFFSGFRRASSEATGIAGSPIRRLRSEVFGPSNLDLQELDVGLYAADPHRLLVPPGQRGRVFGGQVVGQAMHAATLTLPTDGRSVHSLHAYFLKAGRTDRPILYHVENTSDSRSFSTRRVLARQAGAIIYQCQVSFQVSEESDLEHALPMPLGVPKPEDCRSMDEIFEGYRGDPRVQGTSEEATASRAALEQMADFVARNPIEVRPTHEADPLDPDPHPRAPKMSVWMRTRLPLGANPNLHLCSAAFFSDLCLLPTGLLPHGINFPGISSMTKLSLMASLDHAMWFHSPFRADEWVLYDLDSPRAAGNRTLVFGRLYNQAGVLCASVAQEGVVRKRKAGDQQTAPVLPV
ncbi:unnamed protein product [Polarella glacialis]|uniref:Acyl-CoA thioesterase II n=1 Tax=Polarella glacialis TaxID=89957 RepID=A0A813KI43_POLGL|nr:unnamed protein product [Polarella glacialis]